MSFVPKNVPHGDESHAADVFRETTEQIDEKQEVNLFQTIGGHQRVRPYREVSPEEGV